MKPLNIKIYAPNRKSYDHYDVIFEKNSLSITLIAKTVKATWVAPECNPELINWSGNDSNPEWVHWGKGLFHIMNQEGVYPPNIFPKLLEHLWSQWATGEIKFENLQDELNVLANYVNASTEAKPDNSFWAEHF